MTDVVKAYTFKVYNGSTETIRLNSNGDSYLTSGDLGIGTTSPNNKLEVVGNTNISGDLYAGSAGAFTVTGTGSVQANAMQLNGASSCYNIGGDTTLCRDGAANIWAQFRTGSAVNTSQIFRVYSQRPSDSQYERLSIYANNNSNYNLSIEATGSNMTLRNLTMNMGKVAHSGYISVAASDNASQQMCLNITQAGIVGAFKC